MLPTAIAVQRRLEKNEPMLTWRCAEHYQGGWIGVSGFEAIYTFLGYEEDSKGNVTNARTVRVKVG